MELSIINIGNSKGIRLSKTILEKYNIQDKIELILDKDFIVLKPKAEPRKIGKKPSKKCTKTVMTNCFIDDVFDDENFEEWN